MPRGPRIAWLLFLMFPAICAADSAEQILNATGVQGGLIVHLGCGDGKLTASLGIGAAYLVHGLDTDAASVEAARKRIQSESRYGKVSIQKLSGARLPYADNLVNLVVSDDMGQVTQEEVMRVLCPGGIAYIKDAGKWQTTVKSWPSDIDEWTHFLHGPDNNAVAHDSVVDLPRQMKWLGEPKFARAHEQSASFTACVTTAGRIFYIVDEAPRSDIRIPSEWYLVARDAFNGVVLWKRPIAKWIDQMRRFRSGPSEMAFRLAAKDDRVYVTLGLSAPISILDAASGETIADCAGTEHARQVLRLGDRLIILVDTAPELTKEADSQIRRGLKTAPGSRAIVVADAASGKTVWRKEIDPFVHPTLAAQGDRLFYQTKEDLFCVDADSGQEVWRTPRPLELKGHELGWESPSLVVHGKVVYSADFKKMIAYAVADGTVLWETAAKAGYNAPPDIFIVDDLVWLKRGQLTGCDPLTGEVKKTLGAVGGYMHPRCYRNKATDRFFVLGDLGVQFVDREANDAAIHHWMRGTCQYGILPANGMLYVTPDSCACNMKSKLAGLWAIESGPRPTSDADDPPAARLVKGPAYGQLDNAVGEAVGGTDWPIYRHDASRSGVTKASLGAKLKPAWQAKIGGKLSGITAAAGKVYVAEVDAHTVHALDQNSGQQVWSFTTGGRVDSPPTIYKGLALFGSADGWVYAVRASDGELAWRFQAAPNTKLTFVKGQLESVWPVHGSVLVDGDQIVVTAGRSSYLDGGIRVYQLRPQTGDVVSATVMYSPDRDTGKQPTAVERKDVRGALSDILVADGGQTYMRHVKLDIDSGDHTKKGLHLFSPIGLLDDSWWHRAYWLFNDQFVSHWSGWWQVGNRVPSGRILSYDSDSIIGYGRDKYPGGNTGQFAGGEKHQIFACDRPTTTVGASQKTKRPKPGSNPKDRRRGKAAGQKHPAPAYRWTVPEPPFHVRALLVASDLVFVAGPPELAKPQGPGASALTLKNPEETHAAWRGERGGILWALSVSDGSRMSQYELEAPPVFDGMAATDGRLYLATTDGTVVCLSK